MQKAREEYQSCLDRLDQLESIRDEADAAARASRSNAERFRADRYHFHRFLALARWQEELAEEAVYQVRRLRKRLARLLAKLRREGGR